MCVMFSNEPKVAWNGYKHRFEFVRYSVRNVGNKPETQITYFESGDDIPSATSTEPTQ